MRNFRTLCVWKICDTLMHFRGRQTTHLPFQRPHHEHIATRLRQKLSGQTTPAPFQSAHHEHIATRLRQMRSGQIGLLPFQCADLKNVIADGLR